MTEIFFFVDINETFFWYVLEDFKKKKVLVLRRIKILTKNCSQISRKKLYSILFLRGLRHWTPHAFGLSTLVGIG